MLKKSLSMFLAATMTFSIPFSSAFKTTISAEEMPYLNSTLPVEQRVSDLLSRMTLDEKIGQMVQSERATTKPEDVKTYQLGSVLSGGGSLPTPNTAESWANMTDAYQKAAMSTKWGIPILYGVDAVHGHNNVYGATIFPHNIGIGAAGNTELTKNIGKAVAEEVRATGVNWTFAPAVGIPHNERWGRTYEMFGENVELVSKISTAYIQGLQGDNPSNTLKRTDKVIATAKHYLGEGLTTDGKNQGNAVINDSFNADGTVKFNADGTLPSGTLKDELLPPYKAAVDAGVRSVMVTYNSINGAKVHGSADLITKVLKEQLGFKGIVVTDYEGIKQIAGSTQKEKIGKAINAGVDMAMEPNAWKSFITDLTALVNEGTVKQSRIDDAVTRILTVKFEMGLFEDPYAQRDLLSTVGSQAHRDTARQAVRESLVLLKNDNDIVGKLKNMKNILVAGKSAEDIGIQCGGWTITWQGSAGNITPGTTILQGIKNTVGSDVKVDYSKRGGGDLVTPNYDAAVVVIGETPYAETDGDRTADALALSSDDLTTINNIKAANPNLPIVAVMVSGRPLTIADQIDKFNGLVEAWLPGTEGQGVADVLFGSYDFKGKLPITWPWYASDIPNKLTDKTLQLFAYGYGLKKGETTPIPEKPVKPAPPEKTSYEVPGTVKAVDYDKDTSATPGSIEDCSEGGKDIGGIWNGISMNYYVNVVQDGQYQVDFRFAGGRGDASVADLLKLYSGSTLLTTADYHSTGGWQTWDTVTAKKLIDLKAGKQMLTFKAGDWGFNFQWIKFTRVGDIPVEQPKDPITPTGQVLKQDAVSVTMSTSVLPASQSWYDSPKPIPNTLTSKDNLDITAADNTDVTTINIDDSKTYQDILGMGTSIEGSTIANLKKLSPSARTEFLKKLVDPENGAGMNLLRVTIGTPDFTADKFHTYDDMPAGQKDDANLSHFSIQSDIDDGTIEIIKEILAINPNIKLFASSWTAPGWMKEETSSSKSYSDNELLLKGGKLSDAHIDDLAKYYVRYVEEYAKLGIPIYAMTLQNEPMLEINYPSCAISPEQERLISLSIKKQVSESTILKEKNINPLVWAFDHNFDGASSYVTPILSGENGVDGIAYHPYSGDPSAMTQMHNLFPNVPAYLTERSVWGTKGADEIARYFRNWARSYDAWVVMLDSNIAPHQWVGTPDPSMFVRDTNVTDSYWATPEYYLTGQFSKFVETGAVRIDSDYGSASTVTNVAFKNPDGTIVTVVINQTNDDQTFKLINNGTQVMATLPAQTVATYKWNPLSNVKSVPGTILAKNFEAKNGANVVDDGVDGSHVGGMSTGSWLDYIIDVKEPGLYNINSLAAGGTWTDGNGVEQNLIKKIEVAQGEKVLGGTSITNAGWGNYKYNSSTIKFDKAGIQKIRLNITGAFDLRNIKLEKVKEIHNLPGRIEAEQFANANGIVSENGSIGYLDKDDFVEYKVNVAEAGTYDLNLSVSSGNEAPSFDVYSDNEKLGTVNLSKTANWDTFALQSSTINLKAGEQTLKFVVNEGFNLDYFTVGSSIKLTDSQVMENSLNDKVINVELTNGTFADALNKSNWTLNNLPSGINFTIDKVDSTHAKITLSGERTVDFDTDKIVTVSMSAKELAGGDSKDYTIDDSFVITALNDKAVLTANTASIASNAASITVALDGATFNQAKLSDITLSGSLVENGNVKANGIEYVDSTHVKINLSWLAAYYEDLLLTVNVPVSAYSDSADGNTLTADVTCEGSSTLPTALNLTGTGKLSLTEASAYKVKGSLASNVAVGNKLAYYLNVQTEGDYTITYTVDKGNVSNAIKVSLGTGLNLGGNIATISLADKGSSTTILKQTINLTAGQQTLTFEATNTGFAIKAIEISKKVAAQEIKADNPGDETVIAADSLFNGNHYTVENRGTFNTLGYTVSGSYYDYFVNVGRSGKYMVTYSYATSVGGVPAAVLQDAAGKQIGSTPLNPTGGWDNWTNSSSIVVDLKAGEQNLRVLDTVDGFNFKSITLKYVVDSGTPEMSGNDAVIQVGSTNVDLVKVLGITAKDDMDGDITRKVVVDSSKLDVSKAGVYQVTASVEDSSGNKTEKTFDVTVKEDATAPVITGKNAVIAVGSSFNPIRDLTLSITDNKEGNITSQAVVTHKVSTTAAGIFRVKVDASDKAGNTSTAYFVVRVFDGGTIVADPITLEFGAVFNPLTGVKALDLDGKDITSKVTVVSNTVDTNKAGTYKVAYKAIDMDGNTIITERTVVVKEKVTDPGTNPGTDPGTNPGTDPGTNPGTDPGTNSGTTDPITVITDENGNKVAVVSKLENKNGKNTIEVTNSSKVITVEITDLEVLKNGTGSLEIKSGTNVINIPFASIDKSLLVNGAKVIFTLNVEENSSLVKDIKGVKKVFNFNLSVVNGNSTTKIHNFANGTAEITLTLSDEDLKGLNKDKLAVFYYNETAKKYEIMETRVEGNKVIFKTPHFSKFIIAEKATNNSGVSLPKTGSVIDLNVLLFLGITFLLAGIALVVRRKRRMA